MGDHSETLQLEYDPEQITYEELLDVFWKNHNALRLDRSRQYRSILFFHNEEQREKALKKKMEWEQTLGDRIQTEMTAYRTFFLAEDYHQKYYLRRYKAAFQTLSEQFSNFVGLVQSTLIARLNGFVRGFGTLEGIRIEIKDWGLSTADQKAILQILNSLRW